MRNRNSRRIRLIAQAAILGCAATVQSSASGQITSSWLAATSGGWFDSGAWSTPQPPNGTQYDAVISVPGTYAVTLAADASVHSITLSSSQAELDLSTAHTLDLSAGGTLTITAGTVSAFNNFTIRGGHIVNTGGTFIESATLDSVTLRGAMRSDSACQIANGIVLDNGVITLYNYTSSMAGSSSAITGSGTITLSNAELNVAHGAGTHLIGSGVTLDGYGYTASCDNQGTISADSAFGALYIYSNTSQPFVNEGVVEARQSTLAIYSDINVANFSNGTLEGGTWAAYAGHDLAMTNRSVLTNAATIHLDGAGSTFDSISTLQNNLGTLLFTNGQNFTQVLSENDGTIHAGGGGAIAPTISTGTILVDANGSIELSNNGFANNGTVAVTNGTVRVDGTNYTLGTFSVSNGTVQIGAGGSLALSQLQPVLDNTVGSTTLSVAGTLQNTGQTISVNSSKFILSMAGGNVIGGTIDSPDRSALEIVRAATNMLTDVNLNADVVIDAPARLTLSNTTFDERTFTAYGSLLATGSLDAATSGTILFAGGGSLCALSNPASGSLILGSHMYVQSNAACTFGLAGTSFINDGSIIANSAVLSTAAATFLNAGSLQVNPGATVKLVNDWTNDGTIGLTGGTLNLGGTFTTASIGTLQSNGGTVVISGALDNSDATITLNSQHGSWQLTGGTISNGDLVTTDDFPLQVDTVGTLFNMGLHGRIVVTGPAGNLIATACSNDGTIDIQHTMNTGLGSFLNSGTIIIESTGTLLAINNGPFEVTSTGSIRGDGTFSVLSALAQIDGYLNTRLTNVSSATLVVNGKLETTGTLALQSSGTCIFNGDSTSIGTLDVRTGGRFLETDNGSRLISLGALKYQSGGTVDLNNNDLTIGAGSYSGIASLVSTARNGGAWNKAGITSVAARNDPTHSTTIGLVTGLEFLSMWGPNGLFDGQNVLGNELLIRYTYYGDANLNGKVDGGDYARMDLTFGHESTQGNIGGWANGDFDYNGKVDGSDYALADLAFGVQTGTLQRAITFLSGDDRDTDDMTSPALELIVKHFDEFGQPYASAFIAATPEPAGSIIILSIAACTLMQRRRAT